MGTRERAEIRQAKARSLRVFIYQRCWIIFQSSGSQCVEIFSPQETAGNVWRQCTWSPLGEGCNWYHLVGKGQGYH